MWPEVLLAENAREPQLNNNNIVLTIVNINQDIVDTTLKQDKSEGAMAPIVATPVYVTGFGRILLIGFFVKIELDW